MISLQRIARGSEVDLDTGQVRLVEIVLCDADRTRTFRLTDPDSGRSVVVEHVMDEESEAFLAQWDGMTEEQRRQVIDERWGYEQFKRGR